MKTTLSFMAPSDLSVGTVRIMGAGETVADWVATPGNRMFQHDDLKPGVYAAEITPAGVASQSVVFEIKEGEDNRVVLPTFSALSASGSNTSFFDSASGRFSSELSPSGTLAFRTISSVYPSEESASPFPPYETLGQPFSARPFEISKDLRRISIGLSEERRGRDKFKIFRGQTTMELSPGRLELVVPADPDRKLWAPRRVLLSAAIEMVRIERCLLPLYRDGTQITFTAPPFAVSDIEFSVTPADPTVRALVRALDAGTSAEAIAVRKSLLPKNDPSLLLDDNSDPWNAILFGLLAIRFPEIFEKFNLDWSNQLVARAPWAFDARVIHASLTLTTARAVDKRAQLEAVTDAVASLVGALASGSPYYRYANQLFGEMAGGIEDYLQQEDSVLPSATVNKLRGLYRRWRRKLPLQRGAGFTFTWLSRDMDALTKQKILTPYRQPSGKLRHSDTKIIFEGKVAPGSIEVIANMRRSATAPSKAATTTFGLDRADSAGLSEIPALNKPPGPADDPNKGRFGGKASSDGFSLETTFEPVTSRNWVTINFTVRAKDAAAIGLGDFAWFVLHPTFSPRKLKVAFRNGTAKLRLQAYGGFTVGVWIPKFNVELESDLAQLGDAPEIIRYR